MVLLYKLFSHEFSMLDAIDIALVLFLFYQVYNLVKGTFGYKIFLGIVLIYVAYFAAKFIGFPLLTDILGQFVNAGVIALLIVFQPEIRRFLLQLGKAGSGEQRSVLELLRMRKSNSKQYSEETQEIFMALNHFSKTRTGALLVFFSTFRLQDLSNPGTKIEGAISANLMESLFDKGSPLHDGAVVISRGKIVFAGAVLPVSENQEINDRLGTRHRAAIGITENTDGTALIVSEETGTISFAKDGKLQNGVKAEELKALIAEALQG